MPLAILPIVAVLLSVWAFRRHRRIARGRNGSHSSSTFDRLPVGAGRSASFVTPRSRPALADIGLNPLGRWLVAGNAAVLAADILLFTSRGLTLEWSTTWLGAVLLAALLVVWLNFYFVPGARDELFVAEALFVVILMVFADERRVADAIRRGGPRRTVRGSVARGRRRRDRHARAHAGRVDPRPSRHLNRHDDRVRHAVAAISFRSNRPRRAPRARTPLGVRVSFPRLPDRVGRSAGYLAGRLCADLLRVLVHNRR